MAKEIERKFLVADDSWKPLVESSSTITQAYLSANPDATVRIRIRDERAYLTIKSRNHGASRHEWEYEIPLTDAESMLQQCHCTGLISKTRHIVGPWEIDVFHGRLEGLVMAEIELADENQPVDLPQFIGRELTNDPRYYNSSLAESDCLPPLA